MRIKLVAICLALIVGAITALAAGAHAELLAAEPAPGAQLPVSPSEVRLTFTEPVGAQSRILVFAEGFQAVEGLVSQNSTAQPETLYVPLPELEPGVYTVQWSAISDDGHEISGTYSFSVDPNVVASVAQPPEPSATPAPGLSSLPIWLLIIGGLAIAVPLLLVWRQQRG